LKLYDATTSQSISVLGYKLLIITYKVSCWLQIF